MEPDPPVRKSSRVPKQSHKAALLTPQRQKKSNFSKYCAPKITDDSISDDSEASSVQEAINDGNSPLISAKRPQGRLKAWSIVPEKKVAAQTPTSIGQSGTSDRPEAEDELVKASAASPRIRKPSAKASAAQNGSAKSAPVATSVKQRLVSTAKTSLKKRKLEIPESDDELTTEKVVTTKKPPITTDPNNIFDFPAQAMEDDDLTQETPTKPKSSMKKVLIERSELNIEPQSPSRRANKRTSTTHNTLEEDQILSSPTKSLTKSVLITPSKPKSRLAIDSTPGKASNDPLLITPNKSLQNTPRTPRTKRPATVVPDLQVDPFEIDQMKTHVLRKITRKEAVPLHDLSDQYTSVHSLLRETIVRAESNSALLLGPKHTGKSLLVETALRTFSETNAADYVVVRLDGLIHTDDKLALRAMARQLQPESDQEAIANVDIMTALLAILSHPSEFGESGESISIIILLEEFGKFTEHPRQTLLYNLFDIAQSKKAPICVLGMTNRVDAYDSLEKRVKSRFSHRVIQVRPCSTLASFKELALSAILYTGKEETVYTDTWNDYISSNNELDRLIEFTFLTTKDPTDIWTQLVIPLTLLKTGFPDFTALSSTLEPRATNQPPRPQTISFNPTTHGKLELLLPSLTTLEMGLLISAARIVTKDSKLNFATCFDEYHHLSQKTNLSQKLNGVVNLRSYPKEVCRGAFERLVEAKLVNLASGGKGSGGWEFRACTVDVPLIHLAHCVKGYRGFNSSMNQWVSL